MGTVVAGTNDNAGISRTFDSLELSDISTPDELESLRNDLVSGDYQHVSASFEAVSDYLEGVSIQGESKADAEFSRFQDRAKLQSFILKADGGGSVQLCLERESVSVYRYGQTTGETAIDLPDYQTAYLVAQSLLYAMYSVDRFIDQNGLRPVVDEVKERRWVILVTCSLLTAYCQLGNC